MATFDALKWLKTRIPTDGEQWGKWLDLGWKLGVFFLIGLAIYNLFFKKPNANMIQPDSTQRVFVLPGASVDRVQQTSVQKNEQKSEQPKRPWWQPIPYISASAFGTSGGENTETGVKAEVGVRVDLG
jgi:hypothetical protein